MNDNKRLYKKLTTWFWWFLATLPILILVFNLLFVIFNKNYTGSFSANNYINHVWSLFNNFESTGLVYNKIFDMFNSLLTRFGLSALFDLRRFISCALSWFILVHILHLIVDIILLLPRICQKFIERV